MLYNKEEEKSPPKEGIFYSDIFLELYAKFAIVIKIFLP